MSSNESDAPAESQPQVLGSAAASTGSTSGSRAHEADSAFPTLATASQSAPGVEPAPPAASVEPAHAASAGDGGAARVAGPPPGRVDSSAENSASGQLASASALHPSGASSSSSASSHGRAGSAAPPAPQHPKLAFLESLAPADALRYKALAAAKPPLDMCLHMLGEGLPLMEEAEREDLAIALSAAAKAFAVQMCEAAVDVRDAAGDAPDGVVRERHMLEAYARLLRRGLIPGTPEWTGSAEAAAMAGAAGADLSEDPSSAGVAGVAGAASAAGVAGHVPGDVFEALLFGSAAIGSDGAE